MATRNPLELPETGKLLALDVGGKRVGVAVCDSGRRVATARGVWPRPWGELKPKVALEKTAGVVAVVLGLPLNMDGTVGPTATAVYSLADLIEKELGLPVLLWDERMTSRQVESAYFEQRQGRQTRGSKKDSVGSIDAGAAAVILQGVIDRLRHSVRDTLHDIV
ncbi:MAG: Holliday junction resolvase RuvX [Alphaproteobacteria bacterium]|nr:MAG: Holliday junction resolvase RuvX [Alphaproteobacteria bacterium]